MLTGKEEDRTGQIYGPYQLQKKYTSGSFGAIYRATDDLGRVVAIKILHRSLNDQQKAFFLEEAYKLSQLKHHHIIRLFHFGIEGTTPFLAMEFVPYTVTIQPPSRSLLQKRTIISYINQAASALQYAHDQGIVHCDIKPENLLLDNDGMLFISDFGIAISTHDAHEKRRHHIGGTRNYMAPEQRRGHPQPASDQYALGVVTYQLLTGNLPRWGERWLFPLSQILPWYTPKLPPELAPTIFKVLARNPHKRFAHIQTFADTLTQAGATRETASPEPPFGAMKRTHHAWSMLTPLIVIFAILLIGTSIFLSFQNQLRPIQPVYLPVSTSMPPNPDNTLTTVAINTLYQTATSGQPTFISPLNGTDHALWDVDNHTCFFAGGTYHIHVNHTNLFMPCFAHGLHASNFAFQVDLNLLQGDYGGIILRCNSTHTQHYRFLIGTNGLYKFGIATNQAGTKSLSTANSSAILTGKGQINRLTIIALGTHFFLYVNRLFLTEVTDISYTTGALALTAEEDQQSTEVAFHTVRLWLLDKTGLPISSAASPTQNVVHAKL